MPRQTATSHPPPANLEDQLVAMVACEPGHTVAAYHLLLMRENGGYFALDATVRAVARLLTYGAFRMEKAAVSTPNHGATLHPIYARKC